MKPDQVGLIALAVPRDLREIVTRCPNPRLAGQIVRDGVDGNRRNRTIDDSVHRPSGKRPPHSAWEPRPCADAAPDPPSPDPKSRSRLVNTALTARPASPSLIPILTYRSRRDQHHEVLCRPA